MIELIHLVKRFGDLVAVNDLSLVVPRGEFFAVLGPNAAGKTTTIKLLAGLLKPTSGTARVAGYDVQTQPLEARKRLAYVPDFPFLYDKLTPWEFFRFTGQLFRMEDSRIAEGVKNLVARFNLEPYLNQPIEAFPMELASESPSLLPCCTIRKCLSSTNQWSGSTRNMSVW